MTRAELDTLVGWAADEGWNPGLNDAQIFWDTDPQGFVAAELGGELIGRRNEREHLPWWKRLAGWAPNPPSTPLSASEIS